jgi:hypothetical protein
MSSFRSSLCVLPLLPSLVLACSSSTTDEEKTASTEAAFASNDVQPVSLHYAVLGQGGWKVAVETYSYSAFERVTVAFDADPSPGSSAWSDRQGRFLRNIGQSRGLSVATGFEPSGGPAPSELRFAIHHRAIFSGGTGRDAWDNNNGANYVAYRDRPILGRGVDLVVTDARVANDVRFDVKLLVRDIAFEKHVDIIYTTDHWTTKKTASATYERGGFGSAEVWNASAELPRGSTRLDFAVVAHQDAREIWDNNYGANYTCHYSAEAGFTCPEL